MATVTESRPRADEVEEVLVALERNFAAIYGPDMGSWSRAVRGELLEMQRARRAIPCDEQPLHPRKASASRRRRHARQLPWRLNEIAPGAVTILITPVWMDGSGRGVRHFIARALDVDGRIIKFAAGGSHRIASLLQAVYPGVNWDHPLTWTAATGALTDRLSRRAA